MKSSLKTIIYFIAFLSYCYAERLKLKQADVLESKRIGFETVKILEGNIEFQKGNIELKCQNSIYKEKKDIAYLYDDVKMNKEDINLTCDSITFFSKNNKLESTGSPIIQDTEYRLTANKLIYFTDLCYLFNFFQLTRQPGFVNLKNKIRESQQNVLDVNAIFGISIKKKKIML